MLAAMDIALVHAHAAAPFNTAFYSAAATVIPLLLLALTLQERTFQDLLVIRAPRRQWLAPMIAGFILCAGALGEWHAGLALYRGMPAPTRHGPSPPRRSSSWRQSSSPGACPSGEACSRQASRKL
jgi:hypothetical protein